VSVTIAFMPGARRPGFVGAVLAVPAATIAQVVFLDVDTAS
jgi:predicted PurR-regulated permease PerM